MINMADRENVIVKAIQEVLLKRPGTDAVPSNLIILLSSGSRWRGSLIKESRGFHYWTGTPSCKST
jgi:hypothetical protein